MTTQNETKNRTGSRARLGRLVAERARITPAGSLFLALTAVVGLIAYRSGGNLVFAVFALLLATLLVSRLLPGLTARRLVARREVPDEIHAGRRVEFRLVLENRNRILPALAVTVQDLLGVPAFPRSAPPFYPSIPARKAGDARYTVLFRRRGRYRAREYAVESAFPFGFFCRRARGTEPSEFLVLPKRKPIRRHILPPASPKPVFGPDPAERLCQEEEFKGLRPYKHGDPLKKIHWKTSARKKEMMVRVMESQERPKVSVLLDTSVEARTRRLRWSVSLERGVRVAASLVSDLEKRGYLYRFGAMNPDLALSDFGRGPDHLNSILELLAVLASPGKVVTQTLVREAASRAGGHPFVLLVLSHARGEAVKDILARGFPCALKAFDVSRPSLPPVV